MKQLGGELKSGWVVACANFDFEGNWNDLSKVASDDGTNGPSIKFT
jgi:hypothetical protein